MPRKEFAAFTRLDASDVNTFLMDQAVQTFAGTAARGSAISEPVEGMVTYLEDLNRYDTYNGSSHVPMDGLTLIKTQTIGSAVSSVVVSDAFSDDYDNYRIIASGGVGSTEGQISLQLGSLTAGYYASLLFNTYSTNTASATGTNAGSSFPRVGAYNVAVGLTINVDVFSPFLAARTSIASIFARQITSGYAALQAGYANSNTSFTDFTLTPSAGTITGGTIYVYGYKKA